ncbi:NAD binding domain of 6-phosphogluconate dehydrogenase-domain-containing protein [Irpex rosettiformis]|uniref:NAD binding domain of 6-phosphogluconate dehydrogenase-domain-containing protein n=1 Tax=Irpex rosettiformis TaxID=378272 RepID=A0ACB8U216_9APHY|nr:NAD binding domain of 6-phosphogluconate dehydrogenase-domain-containing protein [Irpex rosettiformis]
MSSDGRRSYDGIGFIGIGNMGKWMALNLRKLLPQSTPLNIYDLRVEALQEFLDVSRSLELGPVNICSNSREVAEKSDVTFTIVNEGRHTRDVFLNELSGILTGIVDGKGFVDCSTIDPATSIEVGKAVTESSTAHFYDVPVSGGVIGAEAGTLSFLAGASENDGYFAENISPLLEMMGNNVFYVGRPGQGLVAKLCNNYLSGTCAIATSEAMNIGIRHGIEPKLLSEIFKKSTGGNWQNANMNPVPGVCPDAVTSKGYKGGFKVQMMVKDFTLAMNAAKEVDAKLALGDAGLAAYKATAEDPRCRDLDNRVVYRWLGGIEDYSGVNNVKKD